MNMKKKDYWIRQATIDDLDQLASLIAELFIIEKDFTADVKKQKAGLSLLLDNNRALVLVAEKNNKIIGMVTGQLLVTTAEGGISILLEDMVIHEKFRQKGIGGELLEILIGWGLRKGGTRIQLLVDRNNYPAFSFYHNHGFTRSNMEGLYKMLIQP